MSLEHTDRQGMPWEDSNLLAGGTVALEGLFSVYGNIHRLASPSPGSYEANFTDEALRWAETRSRSQKGGQGGKEQTSGGLRRAS